MRRHWFVLALCVAPGCHCTATHAQIPADIQEASRESLGYLIDRMRPFRAEGTWYEIDGVGHDLIDLAEVPEGAYVIPSFEMHREKAAYRYLTQYRRVFVYDLACQVSCFSLADKHKEAAQLLTALGAMQLEDGSLGFSFNSSGDNFYDHSYKRSGACCWCGYGAVVYERVTGDSTFRPFAQRIAEWVLKRRVSPEAKDDLRRGLITGGAGTWSADYLSLDPARVEWVATEHQVDGYFFLRDLSRLLPPEHPDRGRYAKAADDIKESFLKALWTEDPRHGGPRLLQGVDRQTRNEGRALDLFSWGAIALLSMGRRDGATAVRDYADANFVTRFRPPGAEQGEEVWGYRPYLGMNEGIDWDAYPDIVWSEGSLGVALAHLRLGDRERAWEIVRQMRKLRRPDDPPGALRYARYQQDLRAGGGEEAQDEDFIKDFTQARSACCAAWLVLVVESARPKSADVFWGPD